MRSHSRPIPIPTSDDKNAQIAAVLIFAGAIILLFPLYLFFQIFWRAQTQARIIHTYIPVTATVISSTVTTSTGSKGQVYYYPDIQYEYSVDGKSYRSDGYTPLHESTGENRAQAAVNAYPAGKSVQAFYDPGDPAQAILIRRFSLEPYDMMLGFAFIVTVNIGVFLRIWFFRKQAPAPMQDGWFEILPRFGQRQPLLIACICTVAWYVLGAVPMIHYALNVPGLDSASANPGGEPNFKLFALGGLVPVALVLWYWFRSRYLEDARLQLPSMAVVPGKPCNFRIVQRARSQVEARRIGARIVCTGTIGKGKGRTREVVYEAPVCELTNYTLRPGENLEMSGTLTVPADQPATGRYQTGEYTWIHWTIELSYESGFPKYRATFPIEVKDTIWAESPDVTRKAG